MHFEFTQFTEKCSLEQNQDIKWNSGFMYKKGWVFFCDYFLEQKHIFTPICTHLLKWKSTGLQKILNSFKTFKGIVLKPAHYFGANG